MLKKTMAGWVVTGVVLGLALQAKAGECFDDLTYVMYKAGFSQGVTKNLLADGWTYKFGQVFSNTEYDFGNSEITLNGTLSGQASFSRSGIPEVEFDLSTPSGLSYNYLATDGSNKLTIDDGQLYVDEKIIINKYGGYDIELRLTNKGTLVSDDPEDGQMSLDYDIGPINVHGQWLVDVFNLTIGQACGFTLPGGGLDQLTLGWDELLANEVNQAFGNAKTVDQSAAGMVVVPEPVSLILLVLGGGMIIGRKR